MLLWKHFIVVCQKSLKTFWSCVSTKFVSGSKLILWLLVLQQIAIKSFEEDMNELHFLIWKDHSIVQTMDVIFTFISLPSAAASSSNTMIKYEFYCNCSGYQQDISFSKTYYYSRVALAGPSKRRVRSTQLRDFSKVPNWFRGLRIKLNRDLRIEPWIVTWG